VWGNARGDRVILGPIEFDAPLWLLAAAPLIALAWWIGRRSLSGLSRTGRRLALAVRALTLLAICAALADPHLRRESNDVATIIVADESRSMPPEALERLASYIETAAATAGPSERLGLVTAAEEPYVQALPSDLVRTIETGYVGAQRGTDLASAVRLAMAIAPEDAAGRIVLATDGNETSGSLLSAARSAAAAGVPIDVIPVPFEIEREVIFDRLAAPAAARAGETVNLRFILTATEATSGRLTLLQGGEPIDLDPETSGVSAFVELEAGTNALTIPLTLSSASTQRFEATFTPADAQGDTITENNSAYAVTFVRGGGRTLVLVGPEARYEPLLDVLGRTGVDLDVRPAAGGFESLAELGGFDAVVLVDVSAYTFSRKQQEELLAYAHDLGGGIVTVGGPNSYGAGGWIGSPLADAFPVELDPPQKRHLPKGALAIVIDSSGSMASPVQGTGLTQMQIANEAAVAGIEALSRLDLVMVVAFDSSFRVTVPMQQNEQKNTIARAIRSIGPGGGTNMFPALEFAREELSKADAGAKHIIVLSDGQTGGGAQPGLFERLEEGSITVSTVSIGDATNDPLMQELAVRSGGRWHPVQSRGGLASLPQIFVREAQTVKRALIWEGDPFTPSMTGAGAAPLRGIGPSLPSVSGYIVTADRGGLSQVTMRTPEGDPLLAMWQHGLGRVVAFTSDASPRWTPGWLSWGEATPFWEQHLRWAMRPSGSANLDIDARSEGDRTRLVVRAFDERGDPLNFATLAARVTRPGLESARVDLRQTGAGRYEATLETAEAGVHIVTVQSERSLEGAIERGVAQAAVTRTFSEEHRALRDNRALLLQVAELTGGRVLPVDPAQANLFSREGLIAPISRTSIWLAVALGAVGIFLLDVAVRRVRLDVFAALAALRRAASRQKQEAGARLDALREARSRTQQSLAERSAAAQRETPASEPTYSVDANEALAPRRPPAQRSAAKQEPQRASVVTATKQTTDEDEDGEGISRLLKAKRRAREGMGQENDER